MKKQGFPREHRIRKSAQYQACQNFGQKYHSRHFIIRALYLPENPARFGMAVSRKVGNAVVRNRVKRLLREFFRLRETPCPGWQIVAIAKPGAAHISLQEIFLELGPVLHHLNS